MLDPRFLRLSRSESGDFDVRECSLKSRVYPNEFQVVVLQDQTKVPGLSGAEDTFTRNRFTRTPAPRLSHVGCRVRTNDRSQGCAEVTRFYSTMGHREGMLTSNNADYRRLFPIFEAMTLNLEAGYEDLGRMCGWTGASQRLSRRT